MAARAKKILLEEGSHRAHGEAWARRLCRGDQREAFVARLVETWEHAGRWIGPDDDPEYAAALEAGEVKNGPEFQRELMRKWLTDLLASEGVELTLPELTWDDWDAERRRWNG
jgi:1,2-phenylacetyl-CoA epoxidase catalytic subunit